VNYERNKKGARFFETQCSTVKTKRFSYCLKMFPEHSGSRKSSGSEFQTVGSATENARWP